jgi:hypothetical protein
LLLAIYFYFLGEVGPVVDFGGDGTELKDGPVRDVPEGGSGSSFENASR